MIYTAIKILAVNMHHSNIATHSLLQTSNADILLIQEPWYGHVQVMWSDSDPSGDMVNGVAHNPCWESFLPPHSSSDTCKVSAYVRTGLARSATVVTDTPVRLLVVNRGDFSLLRREVPELTQILLVTLSRRVRQAEARAERMGEASVS